MPPSTRWRRCRSPRTASSLCTRWSKAMSVLPFTADCFYFVQEMVDATVDAMSALPFTADCFQDVGPEVLELVLRDVPLATTEIEVWRAVKAWSDAFFDLFDPDFSPSCSPTAEDADAEPVVPDALKSILRHIDLDCISWPEVVAVRRASHPSLWCQMHHAGDSAPRAL